MTNLVEFPGLGLSLEISRVAFTVFGIPIYWYGVFIGTGMALAVLFAFSKATSFGIDVDRMIDVIFTGFVLAIVFGRLYYVLFVPDMEYHSFLDLINLRNGGIAIYGGIIGGFLGAAIGCKWRKVPMFPMFDIVSMGFLIGQSLGRWGNFFNQEAFGDNTTSIFGMISPATIAYLKEHEPRLSAMGIYVDPYLPVHPTFLYESLWCALGFLVLWLYSKHRRFNGEIALMYVAWYGAGRFVIEGFRTDSLMIGSLRVSQALALASVLAALSVWVIARMRHAGKPLEVPEIPPHTAKVQVHTPDGPEMVVISWPANDRPPSKEQQQTIAKQVLAAGKKQSKEDVEEPEENDEKTSETKGQNSAKDERDKANLDKIDKAAAAKSDAAKEEKSSMPAEGKANKPDTDKDTKAAEKKED